MGGIDLEHDVPLGVGADSDYTDRHGGGTMGAGGMGAVAHASQWDDVDLLGSVGGRMGGGAEGGEGGVGEGGRGGRAGGERGHDMQEKGERVIGLEEVCTGER